MLDRSKRYHFNALLWLAPGLLFLFFGLSARIASGQTTGNPVLVLKSPDLSARLRAADAIGMAAEVRYIPDLVEALDIDDSLDEDMSIRGQIASVIAGFGQPALEPLVNALSSQKKSIWSGTAMALGILQDDRAIAPLVNALKRGENAAIGALANYGQRSIDPLLRLLANRNASVRRDAVITLGLVCGTRCVGPLTAALRDNNTEVRCAAATSLGNIGDCKPASAILNLVQSRTCLVQGIRALEKIGDPSSIGPLLRQKHRERLDLITSAIVNMNGRAVNELVFLLEDRDPWVRWNVAVILGIRQDRRAVVPLIKALKDRDMWVKYHAAEALGSFPDKTSVYPLMCLLKDREYRVRQVAAESLGKLKDIRALPPLQRLLQDPSDIVRQSAANAIRILDDENARRGGN